MAERDRSSLFVFLRRFIEEYVNNRAISATCSCIIISTGEQILRVCDRNLGKGRGR